MMDVESHDTQDAAQEDTLMDAGLAPAQHPTIEHPVQTTPSVDQPSSSATDSTMDVDIHTDHAPAAPTAEPTPVSHTVEQSTPASAEPSTAAAHILDQDSSMSSVAPTALSSNVNNPEDRIDAALAGNDDKDDGYESSDLESSDDDDDESSSDDDSDSDSSTARNQSNGMTIEQRERALIEIDAMDEDEEVAPSSVLHTANEIVQLPEVKKPQITLKADAKLEPVGTVMSIVDNVVVVQAASSGEVRVLDTGTIAVALGEKEEDKEAVKEVLGEIFETFGPVARPLYSIRFNAAAEIPAICKIGCPVYCVPEYSSFVLTGPLKALKGSDASNKFDEEVDEVEMEFSDDEKEMEHKRLLKQAKNKKKGGRERKVPSMTTDTSVAMEAMMGQMPPMSISSAPRKPIALPPRPAFDEPVDGYRILQRPGVMAQSSSTPQTSAATGTIPWYQQQQRELQQMMGTQQHQPPTLKQQQEREQGALQQFQQQQQIQRQLLLQQQQQQQLYQQQQQQQELYQKQIQEAQATILRLQQQQQNLQQQQRQFPASSSSSASPQQPQLAAQQQPQAQQQQQQQSGENSQQHIMNLLSPLFPPQSQYPHQPPQ